MLRGVWALVLLILAGASVPGQAAGNSVPPASRLGRLQAELEVELARAPSPGRRDEVLLRLNQIRNHGAITALLSQIPPGERPRRILYAASGSHMAPLAACDLVPGRIPLEFAFTEVDPAVEGRIDGFLRLVAEKGLLSALESGPPIESPAGERRWAFRWGDHPVKLTLLLDRRGFSDRGNRLFPADALAHADMVVTHDWSGDPLENFRFLYELLATLRAAGTSSTPLVLMEDLEAHPFPIDLHFFGPLARTSEPYGHRDALPTAPGLPEPVELGEPLFGGGVILSLKPAWWRALPSREVRGAFDFLLFDEFDNERLNVLKGGSRPLVSPALLDRSTGFGTRGILGEDSLIHPGLKADMLGAAGKVHALLPPGMRERWACRMLLFRCLAEWEAAGRDPDALLALPRNARHPGEAGEPWPSPQMADLMREARSSAASLEAAWARGRLASRDLLGALRSAGYFAACRTCSAWPAEGPPEDPAAWGRIYLQVREAL